jgi:YidC/Oxa1 family membrane protein insertase
LRNPDARLEVFYVKTFLPLLMPLLNAKVLVLTMTDLHRFHIRRSIRSTHHFYVFHALVSTHMMYRRGAFDHYDAIGCAGPHHVEELRREEALDGLPPKNLIEIGYPRLDRIWADHRLHTPKPRAADSKGLVLIAPSWGPSNILETCIGALIEALSSAGYAVVVRPHPELLKRNPGLIRRIRNDIRRHPKAAMELELLSDRTLHDADVLVTDWSGIALEYALGTERPVMFIDVPRKVWNPEYEKWNIEPLEAAVREQIGLVMNPQDLGQVAERIGWLIAYKETFRERILQVRSRCVFNFGRSAEAAADYIQKACQRSAT